MSDFLTGMQARWPAVVAGNDTLRDSLLTAYDEPHRGYHDLTHLEEVLARIEAILAAAPDLGVDRDAVLLAAWFHDAVYEPAEDNEERSARLAERELGRAEVAPALVAEVARLVRLTATHEVTEGDVSGAVLCDADLAILAADATRYAEYVAGVRKEYAAVPDDDFARGRSAVLQALADQPRLFHTAYGAEQWEATARRNLERELAELGRP